MIQAVIMILLCRAVVARWKEGTNMCRLNNARGKLCQDGSLKKATSVGTILMTNMDALGFNQPVFH